MVNGLITLRGFNPIVVTIGTLSAMSGLAAAIASGYTIPGLDALTFMGTERYLGVPAPVWIVAALFVVLTVFLTRTRDGIRMQTGLLVETGEAREVHDFAALFGFGAAAVNPYLALDTVRSWKPCHRVATDPRGNPFIRAVPSTLRGEGVGAEPGRS